MSHDLYVPVSDVSERLAALDTTVEGLVGELRDAAADRPTRRERIATELLAAMISADPSVPNGNSISQSRWDTLCQMAWYGADMLVAKDPAVRERVERGG